MAESGYDESELEVLSGTEEGWAGVETGHQVLSHFMSTVIKYFVIVYSIR